MDFGGVKSLASSRKFWLVLVGIAGALVMFAYGLITAEQLGDTIQTLVALLVGGIAVEDAAEKFGARQSRTVISTSTGQ